MLHTKNKGHRNVRELLHTKVRNKCKRNKYFSTNQKTFGEKQLEFYEISVLFAVQK